MDHIHLFDPFGTIMGLSQKKVQMSVFTSLKKPLSGWIGAIISKYKLQQFFMNSAIYFLIPLNLFLFVFFRHTSSHQHD